jgi:hypothetical protein
VSKEGIYDVVRCGAGFRAQLTNGSLTKFADGRTPEEAKRRFSYRVEWVIEAHGKKYFGQSQDEVELAARAASNPLIQNPTAWAAAVIRKRQKKPA